jgi:hypothetical protein
MVRHDVLTLALSFSDGSRIETTSEHPFYVEGKGFIKAGELGIGTSTVTRAGPNLTVTKVARDVCSATVDNLTVDEFHTYFVGSSGAWVHNWCFADQLP